ncbi:hypothetical protein [Leptolyngbya sp. CCY15150]|uniref:hypothetical protein n=1 Tax=Leptolyngbya sp. CCY15150 TaxID=2767772 RepID=UPI0019518DB0|nr:hypothetical protein [Leptolyngbya sp. CCY15150]
MLTSIGDLRVQDDVLVRIRGRVVNVRDDEFLLRDRTGSVWVDARRRVNLRVGERVTVVGDFDDNDFDARRIIRVGGSNPNNPVNPNPPNRPGPIPRVNIGNLEVRDDELVRIRGRVVRVRDDEFFLRDRTGSVWVDARRRVNLRVGEQVTVVGDFDDNDFDARRIIRNQPRNRSMARSSASDSGVGTDGKDGLTGTSGRDSLHGQRSRDRLVGGSDRLTGGGSDRFVYSSIQDAGDRITNFNPVNDRLDLRQIFRQPQYASQDPFSDYLDLQQTSRGTAVRIDPDGDVGNASFITLTTLTGVNRNQLNASQFQV